MRSHRAISVPSGVVLARAVEAGVPGLDGDKVYAIAQGHDFDDAPHDEDTRQPWVVSSLSGLGIVVGSADNDDESWELALWRPWTDAVSARSLPQQGVVEITWIDGTTSALEITDRSRRRRRGVALSIKEQIQGSIIVSERHVIAGQEVVVAVRRSEHEGTFSQVLGGDPVVLNDPDVALQVNAIESKLRSMCGLAP